MSQSPHGLLALLHRANQIATERFAHTVGDTELTPRQAQVLASIEANEGLSQTRIVADTGIDRSTLADIIRRLQKRGLIERRRTKDGARAYAVKLTAAGRREVANGKPVLASVEKALLSALAAKQRAELLSMLLTVVAAGETEAAKSGRP
jgi:DNA-binding MarR family transcriptional regulator